MQMQENLTRWLESLTQEERKALFETMNNKKLKEHYHKLTVNDQPFEAFDLIDALAPHVPSEIKFYVDSIIKYIVRLPFKNQAESDLKKNEDYAREARKRLKEED